MKRLRMWLRELSLFRQLLAIIFLFVTIFAAFVVVFLAPSIDKFSETEMYRILHYSLEGMTRYYSDNQEIITAPYLGGDLSLSDLLYVPEESTFYIISGQMPDLDVQKDILLHVEEGIPGTNDCKVTVTAMDKDTGMDTTETYLYSMTRLKDGRYVVSLMNDSYQTQLQSSLASSVVMINILFVGVLFILLMLWVGSLIIPLSQIRSYITKLKDDEENAVLHVHRNDEIGEVANALRDMEAELSRQNQEKEEMIQNISHDLKTPIATIKSYGESIKDGIYPYETLEKSVDVIIEHADRLEKKVQSLIVLNKMGYLKDEGGEEENLNMSDVIEKVILSLKVIRPEIAFIRNVDESVCFHGEEEPWRIVVENLIDNALRYAKTYIKVTLEDNELCVINDGIPIRAEYMEKMFNPYEKGTDGKFGLGLSIVHRVTQTYGYRVNAENLPEGVCFRVYKEVPKRNRKEKHRKADAS